MVELKVKNLRLTLDNKRVLNDISFSLTQGELVIMLGPNGAGKSMTLRTLMGVDKNTEKHSTGTTHLDGHNIRDLSALVKAKYISYLPQNRPLAWPNIVRDIVALGRFAYGASPAHLSSTDQAFVDQAMASCGISHLANRHSDQLSGGELARVHCARAFAAKTPVLIADEPVSALDPRQQIQIMELFKSYVANGGGALIILHDINLAARYADRLLWLKDGKIDADGSVEDTLNPERLRHIYGIEASIEGTKIDITGTS